MVFFALIASLGGLYSATYLYRKKRKKKKLICPRGADCDKVIHSTYATTLGIPNEVLGVAFYCTTTILLAFVAFFPAVFVTPLVVGSLQILALCGVLFSLYFIVLQELILSAWCSWCMLSALAAIALFLSVFFGLFPTARF